MSALPLRRRAFVGGAAALAAAPAWPAPAKEAVRPRVLQLIDPSAGQQELVRDYATGIRLAWGLAGAQRGRTQLPELGTRQIDPARPEGLTELVAELRRDPSVIAMVGSVGEALAAEAVAATRAAGLRIAHIGPWNADARLDEHDEVLALFPSRATQLRHAIVTTRGMGIDSLAAVYAEAREAAAHGARIADTARAAGLAHTALTLRPGQGWDALAGELAQHSAGMVVFLGSAIELATFTQAMARRRLHRFVLALSDIDHATLVQLRPGQGVPLILTQVVPYPGSSSLRLVADYRRALKDLYDEAPAPLSLAGYVAGQCALEAIRRAGSTPDRAAVLAEAQRRTPLDLGGFRLDFASGRRGSNYVTHTLLRADGTLVG